MKIAYHFPYPDTITANRTIARGFEKAFVDMGNSFAFFTLDNDLKKFLDNFKPDIFITSTHGLFLKSLDLDLLKKHREMGLCVISRIGAWKIPNNTKQERISESKGACQNTSLISNIKKGIIADSFFHVIEQGDYRMDGFTETTGYEYHTIPLAVDKTLINTNIEEKFKADLSFIGTNSPDKQDIFNERLFPLSKKYDLKLYGQDWTKGDRILGWVQKGGQYLNLPFLKTIRKPKLKFEDEGDIYKSSKISINLHESHQRTCGGDCNERTFKVPAFGGFQIMDDVKCIEQYFEVGKEVVVAKDTKDWFEKIEYYMNNPDERTKIVAAGRKRALKDHTYHNRAQQFIDIYNSLKK